MQYYIKKESSDLESSLIWLFFASNKKIGSYDRVNKLIGVDETDSKVVINQ